MPKAASALNGRFVRGFLQGAVLQGHDPYAILEQAGIDRACYDDPDSAIDGVQFHRLVETIITTLNDLYLGFLKQPWKRFQDFVVIKETIGYKTLGEGIRIRTQYRESLRDDVHYGIDVDAKTHTFSLSVGNFALVEEVDEYLFYWLRLSSIYRYHSWLIGRRIKLKRVDFTAPAPDYGDTHLKLFGCEVHFNQPHNRLYFDSRYLNYPIVRTDAELSSMDFAKNFPDWLQVPGRDQSMTRQVEQVLTDLHQDEVHNPTIEEVAALLRIKSRTLRTQLERENQTFQQIKDEVRKELAVKHLVTTDLPIAIVALDLGFVEPGDFSRTFKRWTGHSPSNYRKQFS